MEFLVERSYKVSLQDFTFITNEDSHYKPYFIADNTAGSTDLMLLRVQAAALAGEETTLWT